VERLGDGERLEVGYARVMLAPVGPLVLLVAGMLAGLNAGAVVLLLLLLLVVTGVAVIGLLSPAVVVEGGRLSVLGREDRRRAPGGSVDLGRLASATSVSYQGGLVSGRGLPLFRNRLRLQDADGGEAIIPAWGWTPRQPLRAALGQAVAATGAHTDALTRRRLGTERR
jgi:hypothetical protein